MTTRHGHPDDHEAPRIDRHLALEIIGLLVLMTLGIAAILAAMLAITGATY